MMRRRIVFIDDHGTTYISPEFNGDKAEAEYHRLIDTCDHNWNHIETLFRQCGSISDFKAACITVQGFYHSSVAPSAEPEPAVPVSELETLPKCDYLFIYSPKGRWTIHSVEVSRDE